MNSLFSGETIFARFMNLLAGILWVGILWLVCSLPLITLPAASMAAYHCMSRCVRRHNGYITTVFFSHLWKQLKRWIAVAFLELILLAWLLFDIIYLYGYGTEFSQTLSYITYGIFVLYLGVNTMLFPAASRFAGSRFHIFKMAFYMTFRHIWASIALVLLFAAGLYAMYLMPWSLLPVPGVYWYLCSLMLEGVLKKYTIPVYEEDEEDEEEDEAEPDEEYDDEYDDEDDDEPEDADRNDAEEDAPIEGSAEEVISDDGDIVESRLGNLIIRRRRGKKLKEAQEEPVYDQDKKTERRSFWDRIVRK